MPSNIYTDLLGSLQSDGLGAAAVDFGGVMIKDLRLAGNFGAGEGGRDDPQSSKAWRYAHDAAAAFTRSDEPDVSVVYRHLDEMLSPLSGPVVAAPTSRRAEFLNFLEQGLESPKAWVRRAAAAALKGRSDAASLALIARALGDSDSYVRAAAAAALKWRSDAASLALIERALGDLDPRARVVAAQALKGRSDDRAQALLSALMSDPEFADIRLELKHGRITRRAANPLYTK